MHQNLKFVDKNFNIFWKGEILTTRLSSD